jgi:hypothetical protein
MKKFITFFIVLLIASGAVFYFGWIQFAVPADKYGVMVSKTGGVHPRAIRRGEFAWRPERLLPTNTRIMLFAAEPLRTTQTIEGELPSARLYSEWLKLATADSNKENTADFSYSVTFSVAAAARAESLAALYEHGDITDQDSLDAFLSQKCHEAARLACQALIDQKAVDSVFLAELAAQSAFSDVAITTLYVEHARIPDMELYARARESHGGYRNQVNTALSALAQEHAYSAMKSGIAMDQLEKLGELMQKYPSLLELLTKTNSPVELLKEIGGVL